MLRSLGALGVGLLVCACGVGKDANVGTDTHGLTDGGASGGASASGGSASGSGASTGTGANTGSGASTGHGASTGSGGATTGHGGVTGSGGATTGSGGATSTGGGHGGIACGTATCGAGQYCCNASCNMCAPMGAACIQIACDPQPTPDAGHCIDNVACIKGTVWSPTQCKCVPDSTGGTCTTAADCHLTANYCGGCNCLALTTGQKVPECANGDIVSCFADPCLSKTAACVSGHCVAQ